MVYGNWFPSFLCINFLFFNVCISFPSNKEYSGGLEWYKHAWLDFLDSVLNTLTGTEPQSQICQHIPLNLLSSSDRDNKNEESPVHCKWVCYVQTDPCFSSLSFPEGKPVVGKNSVVLLLPACRSEARGGNWYGRCRASTLNVIKIQWKVVENQVYFKKIPPALFRPSI